MCKALTRQRICIGVGRCQEASRLVDDRIDKRLFALRIRKRLGGFSERSSVFFLRRRLVDDNAQVVQDERRHAPDAGHDVAESLRGAQAHRTTAHGGDLHELAELIRAVSHAKQHGTVCGQHQIIFFDSATGGRGQCIED